MSKRNYHNAYQNAERQLGIVLAREGYLTSVLSNLADAVRKAGLTNPRIDACLRDADQALVAEVMG